MKEIPLTQGFKCVVDDEDFERLVLHKWHAKIRTPRHVYACRSVPVLVETKVWGKIDKLYMHRDVIDVPPGFHIDHINGNTLDNRKSNLRIVTNSQNQMNTSTRQGRRWKGISFHKSFRKWEARIWVNKKLLSLGCFETAEEAAFAYDEAARKYYGEYAALNFPKEGERGAFRGAA